MRANARVDSLDEMMAAEEEADYIRVNVSQRRMYLAVILNKARM